jgi:hypothetical protein
VLNSLQGLKDLKRIILDGCALVSLPQKAFSGFFWGGMVIMFISCAMTSHPLAEAFTGMTKLENLIIRDCKKLVSLNGIQGLASLSYLTMSSCDGLVEDISSEPVDSARLSECALELAELDIDHPSVLMKDLLWWITTVKTL